VFTKALNQPHMGVSPVALAAGDGEARISPSEFP
jgi:hypothetical protein